ncbi:hypothetical protein ACRZ5S_22665 (plasmid) [Vibrio scophthalmi]|uniref:hypothetical protein n=1 Tax=Vibrio scophthalmi TaxID=45658 RepID=UPI003EBA8905
MLKTLAQIRSVPERGEVNIDYVLRLPSEDSGLTNSIVRFDNSRVAAFNQSKGKFVRRKAVKITNVENKQWIIRYVMGNGGTVKGLKRNCIAIDYDGIVDLSVSYKQPVSLQIKYANWCDTAVWFWDYPELNIRWSFRLGVTGFALGLISIADLLLSMIV